MAEYNVDDDIFMAIVDQVDRENQDATINWLMDVDDDALIAAVEEVERQNQNTVMADDILIAALEPRLEMQNQETEHAIVAPCEQSETPAHHIPPGDDGDDIFDAQQVDWDFAYEQAIENLNTSVDTHRVDLATYYEDIGRILAELPSENQAGVSDSSEDGGNNKHINGGGGVCNTPIRNGTGVLISSSFGETRTDFIQKKACVLKYRIPKKLQNTNQYCLPYAIVVARAHLQYKQGEISYKDLRRQQEGFNLLNTTTRNLCIEAGVNLNDLKDWCSFDEVKKFQAILPEYQIVIYKGIDMKTRPYTDSRYYSDRKLNIMLHENHYMAMRSVTACFPQAYICPDCHTSAPSITIHSCKYACSFCERTPKCSPCADEEMISCVECNGDFLGDICYMKHILPKGSASLSVCNVRKKCPICKVGFTSKEEHFCGVFYCMTCEKYESYNHLCQMQSPIEIAESLK